MKNYLFVSMLTALFFICCKEKKKTPEERPISALSIIKGQLRDIDTSLYQLTKFETTGNKTDTSFIRREEVRSLAAPFLSLPEIANESYTMRYNEERLIDAQQQTLSIISMAKDETAEIQKQIMIINLEDISSGKVQSIYIDRYISAGDSTVEQKLFWEIDSYFSVGSITEKQDQPGKTHFTKIAWQ